MNSFIAGSAFSPGPPNREPTDSEGLWETIERHAWRVDKASDRRSYQKLRVYTVSEANCLKQIKIPQFKLFTEGGGGGGQRKWMSQK